MVSCFSKTQTTLYGHRLSWSWSWNCQLLLLLNVSDNCYTCRIVSFQPFTVVSINILSYLKYRLLRKLLTDAGETEMEKMCSPCHRPSARGWHQLIWPARISISTRQSDYYEQTESKMLSRTRLRAADRWAFETETSPNSKQPSATSPPPSSSSSSSSS